MAGTKAGKGGDEQWEQEGTVSWAVKETSLNAAGLRAAQGEGNLKLFCVSVNVVDMILSKLSWNRLSCLCSSPCLNKVDGNRGNGSIVSVMFCLSEGQVSL